MDKILLDLVHSTSLDFFPERRKKSPLIFHDHSGDGYFLDVTKTEPVIFYDMLETPDSMGEFGNITNFFRFVLEIWETTEITVENEGFVNFDFDRCYEIQEKYLK